MWKLACFALLLFFHYPCPAQAHSEDYTLYHQGIINAENEIFALNKPQEGLKTFKKTFDSYDFVYVDDCIEAFQLALFYKQEGLAMQFIKKALANGFELHLLGLLNTRCPCTYLRNGKKVAIFDGFIAKNKTVLEAYADSCYGHYVQRIGKGLFAALLKRHVTEQFFKNYHKEIGMGIKEQNDAYKKICDDNLHFMDSLAALGIYLGERNLGIYTNKLAHGLKLPFGTVENYVASTLSAYGCPKGTHVPVLDESAYFDIGPVYNMQFHNARSYDVLLKYRDGAVKKGYVHPREFASLRYNAEPWRANPDMHLAPEDTAKKITDTRAMDEKRKSMLLPSYESDYNKHLFGHRNDLQLCFGFFNGTR